MQEWWEDLNQRAKVYYSQTGEDGILRWIFEHLPEVRDPFLVDLGAGDGYQLSNTRYFVDNGWGNLLFDMAHAGKGGAPRAGGVIGEFIASTNVAEVLEKWGCPKQFDLLSLDLDGQDFWVLRALLRAGFRPRVIVCEINPELPAGPPMTVPEYPPWQHDGTSWFGMNLGAARELGRSYGYTLVCQRCSMNAFLVQDALLPPETRVSVPFQIVRCLAPDMKKRTFQNLGDGDLR